MIYKVPCPTNTNGIRLFKEGNQIAVEYTRGEPNVTMAYDSVLGRSAHTLSFRQPSMHPDTQRILEDTKRKLYAGLYGRDELPSGTGIVRSKTKMAPRGSMNINDEDLDEDDDGDEVVTKLMSYLNDKLTPEQLSSVAAILGSADDDAPDLDAGEPRRQASDRRRAARLAADAARYRLPTAAEDAEFNALFPSAKLLKLR